MQNLVKKIQNISYQHNLWKEKSKIVVGVSGGPDSVCLLNILLRLQKSDQLELIIAHVNYGLRGKESEQDEKFVRLLAAKNNLEIEVLKVAKENTDKVSENSLRNIRYDFFEKIKQANKFDLIAVAHNADDQVETFLMRVLRGAGLQGLSSMKFKNVHPVKSSPKRGVRQSVQFNGGTIIRPLLGISRKKILEFLQNQNLTYRTDKTNAESLFLRNKIRNKLIPYLEKNYNPNIRKTIFDSTASIAQDYAYINEVAQKAYQRNKDLTVTKLLALHPAIQRRVLLQAIAEKKLNTQNIELAHIEEILKALRSTKGKNQIVLFQGLKMTRKGDKITISKT